MTMNNIFFVDTETFGSVNLKKHGFDRYVNGEVLECLIATYARDGKPVGCWDITSGAPMPSEFEDNILDERVKKVAHNAPFDKPVIARALGLETDWSTWHCTMSQAYAHGLPGSLDALGPVLGLPLEMRKLKRGEELIQLFCVPKKGQKRNTFETHPDEWIEFLEYAIQDTAALREIYKRMPTHNYRDDNYMLWVADMEINERGFLVDTELCSAAVDMKETMAADLNRRIEKLTDGRITKPTQRERIQYEVVGEYGIMMLDLTRDTIERMLEQPTLDPDVRELLELRLAGSLTSLTKYERALERVGPDKRMRNTLQYSGAGRTGRWAGRGVQPHNMPRPKRDAEEIVDVIVPAILDGSLPEKYVDINGACQDALRSMIIAGEDSELVVSDWSNIEGRCVAWEAGEHWKLEAFAMNDAGQGEDLYKLLFSQLMARPIESITKDDRQQGKACELAFGYGGGVGACVTAAATYGVDLPVIASTALENAPDAVCAKAERAWERAFIRGEDFLLEPEVYMGLDAAKQLYRKTNKNIAQLWWDIERAVKWAIERPGALQHAGRCKIWCTPKYLIIELPSGRRLLYAQPKLRTTVEFDEESEDMKKRVSISYMHASAKQWKRTYSYGGKLVENITQAIANDVLRAALLKLREDGWPVILHVHDEVVAEVPNAMRPLGFDLEDMNAILERPLWWADGLPLKAAGYTAKRYKKD